MITISGLCSSRIFSASRPLWATETRSIQFTSVREYSTSSRSNSGRTAISTLACFLMVSPTRKYDQSGKYAVGNWLNYMLGFRNRVFLLGLQQCRQFSKEQSSRQDLESCQKSDRPRSVATSCQFDLERIPGIR